jgi:LysR family transcriptional regulator, hca operon transcriptional activator
VELRHLRYFVAVAEELNFRRAAARLHIAPPPLSVQIRHLEREIGADLLSRQGRNVSLTEAGRVFLEQARQTLAHAKRAVALARQTANGETGHLSIGYNTVAEFGVFPKIIPAFKSRWPNVHLTFHGRRTPEQFAALSRDELDLGFVCPPPPTDAFDMQDLTKQPFVVVLSVDHPLASAPIVSFDILSKEPLILYSRLLDPETFHEIEQHFMRAAAVMNVAYEFETSLSMINFVAAGNGCCIVPDYASNFRQHGIVCKPLGPPSIVRTLAIAKKKGRGGLAESFYRFAVDRLCADGV